MICVGGYDIIYLPFPGRHVQKPTLQAVVICDHMYQDKATDKTVLSGTFGRIMSQSFPARHGNLGIYVALTDVSRSGRVQVVLRSAENENFAVPLPPWEIVVRDQNSRLGTAEVGGNVAGLVFPVSGIYEFAVFWDDVWLGGKRIEVGQLQLPAKGKQ